MGSDFWRSKWKNNQIGFHLKDVHPLLKKYFDKVFSDSQSVFVPLCGKTLDMRYLYAQKKSVIGCELSEIAANDFYSSEEKDGALSISDDPKINNHKIYSIEDKAQSLKIYIGDYFNLDQAVLNECESIYDRAALIALPSDIRALYVTHLITIMPKAKMLLITLDYDQDKMAGPPFSVEQSEVERLFSFATIETLKRSDIIEDEAQFKSKGLSHFYQTAYFIEWDLK